MAAVPQLHLNRTCIVLSCALQEAEEEEDKEEELGEVVQTRGMGGRSMSGSSVRFQHEPDVVHFDTDVPDKEEPLAIASEPAEAEPAEAEAPSTAPAQAGEPAEAVEKPDLAGGPASEVEAADTAEPAEAEPVAKSLQPLLQATQLEPESSDAQPVASNATDVGHAPKQAAPEAPEAPEAAVATAVAPASQSLAAAAELATTTRPCPSVPLTVFSVGKSGSLACKKVAYGGSTQPSDSGKLLPRRPRQPPKRLLGPRQVRKVQRRQYRACGWLASMAHWLQNV